MISDPVIDKLRVLYFKHEYFKFQNGVFPTVRGRTSNYRNGEFLRIDTPSRKYIAQVLSVEYKLIKELSTPFMELDGSYEGYHVYNHIRFIDLLNSFRRFHKIKDANERICVIWLRKESWLNVEK